MPTPTPTYLTHALVMSEVMRKFNTYQRTPQKAIATFDSHQKYATGVLMDAALAHAVQCNSQGITPNRKFKYQDVDYDFEYLTHGNETKVTLVHPESRARLMSVVTGIHHGATSKVNG